MHTRLVKMILCLSLAAPVVIWMGSPVLARPPYLEAMKKTYGLSDANGKCLVCHEVKGNEKPNKKNLNFFGKAVLAEADKNHLPKRADAILKALQALETEDADGDGATNKEELLLGTYPADAASKPDPKKIEEYRKIQSQK